MYDLDTWLHDLNTDFTLKDCLFGAVTLTRKAELDKCSYSEYDIGFNSRSHFVISNFDFGKNVIIFGVENTASTHGDNKKKGFEKIF